MFPSLEHTKFLCRNTHHREYRVAVFLSSYPNWVPHPSPAWECCSPPRVQGGDTLACGRGGGGSQSGRGDRHCSTLGINVFFNFVVYYNPSTTHTFIPQQHTHSSLNNTHLHPSTTHTFIPQQHTPSSLNDTHLHPSTTHTFIPQRHTPSSLNDTHLHPSMTHTFIPQRHTPSTLLLWGGMFVWNFLVSSLHLNRFS